jgi:small subunit ribosomal protein S16
MLKIKLARFGKRKQPHYRIVVNEAKDKRDGAYVESLGHYGPTQQPKLLELDLDRYQYWLEHGAQPTDTVAFLAKVAKNGGKFPEKKKKPSKKKQAKENKTDK